MTSSLWLALALLPPPPPAALPAQDASRPAHEVTVPSFPNAVCPIMGKPISAKLFVDTDVGRIWMCCKSCASKIRDDVAAADATAYPLATKAENAKCPITGKPASPGHVVRLQGHEIALCCDDCIKPATDEAQVTLALALDPKLEHVNNATCPVTGEPVAKNVICVVDGVLIHLSSARCVDLVKADPVAAVAKARTLVADAAKTAPTSPVAPTGGSASRPTGEKDGR